MEAALAGILIIGVAIASVSAVAAGLFMGLSILAALLVYSLIGTLGVLFIGWRKFRCAETHEDLAAELRRGDQ